MGRVLSTVMAVAILMAMCGGASHAQGGAWEESWHDQGDPSTRTYGGALSALGDLDGDGRLEFSVACAAGVDPVGKVFLYSGAAAQLSYVLAGTQPDGDFGSAVVSVPDRDADGCRDLLIGTPRWDFPGYFSNGKIGLYSGSSGVLLQEIDGRAYAAKNFGKGLAHAGDLDGDGREDFLVDASASLLAISSTRGDFLWGAYPVASSSSPDAPFASLGVDLNGDGVWEVVAGDPQWPDPYSFHLGLVWLLSGKDGSLIWKSSPGTVGLLGFNLAVVGDIDGDSIPDILAGEPGDAPYGVPWPSRALLLSGVDGSILRAHDSSPSGEWMGHDVGALGGSVDSDDVPDYVVATPWYSNPLVSYDHEGKVDVYSGADGQLLVTFYGDAPGGKFGWRCISPGDLDGDGFPELLVGAPFEEHVGGTKNVGGAHMFSFRPLLTVAPSNLSLSAGTPSVAALDFPTQEAAWPYAVLASATGIGPTVIGGVEVPLSADPLLARMVGGWTPPLLQNGQGILDAQGDATALIHPSPALAAYLGRTFWIAAVSWDPGWGQVRLSSVARPLTVVP